jgi:hypothetical protein
VKKKIVIKRRNGPYRLPKNNSKEGWFYTNTGSVDLVVYDGQKSIIFRLWVRDLKKIVKALGKAK